MTELKIPDAAYDLCKTDAARYAITVTAPLIVAAELRRLSQELISEENANKIWRTLSQRARELDPQGVTK